MSIDRQGAEFGGIKIPVGIVSFPTNETQYARLRITNCVDLVDAKLDKQSGTLAVLICNGLNLGYLRYVNTNGYWALEQAVNLVEYSATLDTYGNRLELQTLYTVRISFIKKGESFSKGGRHKGTELPGDEVYFIRVTKEGKVLINDQERKSLQWHPDIGTKE